MAAAGGPGPGGDVRLCGYLRKQKSQHRRYFVLRGGGAGGPARLECYASEKQFRAGGGPAAAAAARPKRAFPLAQALSISMRADARHRHLLVLCGRGGTFGVAAESAEQQQAWYAALVELHAAGKASLDGGGDSVVSGPAFKEAWQVSLRPRGLGHTKNLAGTYLLCLTDKTISFVKLNTDVAAVVLQLLNVRRCGHSENYFFMEVGRSAVTGPGELWMQVDDLVVAQNMHETILEAMKALSEEFRVRSKSQPLASTPILVPSRQQHLSTPPPSQAAFPLRPRPEGPPAVSRSPGPPRQQGAGLQKPGSLSDYSTVSSDEGGSSPGDLRPPDASDRLSYLVAEGELDYISMGKLEGRGLAKWGLGLEPHKWASLPPMALEKDTSRLPQRKLTLKSVATSASYPEGLNRRADHGYMAMLPGVARSMEDQAYIPMTPGSTSPPQESRGYMLMSPSGNCSPDGVGQWVPRGGGCEFSAGDYMNMSPSSRSASSTPPEYSPLLPLPGGAPFFSLPRSYKHGARLFPFNPGRLSGSSSSSSESLEESADTSCLAHPPPRLSVGGRGTPAAPRSSGEYVSITYGSRAPGCVQLELQAVPAEAGGVAMPAGDLSTAPGTHLVQADAQGRRCHESETFPDAEWDGAPACKARTEQGLNYVDLDLAKEAGEEMPATPRSVAAAAPSQGGPVHTYASIDFHRLWELRGCKPSPE